MKLLSEDMSTETSTVFEELFGPFIQKILSSPPPAYIKFNKIYVQIWISIFAMFVV